MSAPFRSFSLLALMLCAGFLPSALRAQTVAVQNRVPVAAGPSQTAGPIQSVGPRRLPLDLVRWPWSIPRFEAPPQNRVNAGSNVAMMGAGAAGVVVGSIIGGDGGMMIAVGGEWSG